MSTKDLRLTSLFNGLPLIGPLFTKSAEVRLSPKSKLMLVIFLPGRIRLLVCPVVLVRNLHPHSNVLLGMISHSAMRLTSQSYWINPKAGVVQLKFPASN